MNRLRRTEFAIFISLMWSLLLNDLTKQNLFRILNSSTGEKRLKSGGRWFLLILYFACYLVAVTSICSGIYSCFLSLFIHLFSILVEAALYFSYILTACIFDNCKMKNILLLLYL